MSALPERRDPIDIEEFERRLRAPTPSRAKEDPLAELARLVAAQPGAEQDPFAALFNEAPRRVVPRTDGPDVPAPAPEPMIDFPDLRPLLRGGDFDLAPPVPGGMRPSMAGAPGPDEIHASGEYQDWAESADVAPDAPAPEVPRERSRKPLYVAAAVIAAGFVGIGATLAFRGGAHQAEGVATIAASLSPTKIQPKEAEGGDHAGRDSTMLDKTPAPTVKKVVSRDEQPMDVNAAAKTPRIIPLSDDPSPAVTSSTSGAAAVVPPPPPTREPNQARSAFPEPKRVKTVSVRADGSIIGGAAEAIPAAQSSAPQPPPRPAMPAKDATPKSATRATPVTPAARPPKPVAARPAAAPKAETRTHVAVAPPADVEAAAGQRAAPGGGGYAVQLAAPGSEADARKVAERLGEKYASALGGRRPSVQKAADKAIYRVRVTGLSRESANVMCEQIKSAGGACFVAR